MSNLESTLSSPSLALAGYLTTYKGARAPLQELMVENPMNVMEAAEPVVNRILEIKGAEPKAKIIVNVGEHHAMPTHQLTRAAILTRVIGKGFNCVYANERSHNKLIEIGNDLYGMALSYDQVEALKSHDGNGKNILKASITNLFPFSAPESYLVTSLWCLEKEVKTIFTDAAIEKNDMLSIRDPFTNQYLKNEESIHVQDWEGMAFRNEIISYHQFKALLRNDILIQGTGMNHIWGSRELEDEIEHSLSGIFNRVRSDYEHLYQINVFPIAFDTGIKNIPHGATEAHMENSVMISGLSDAGFYHGDYFERHGDIDLDLIQTEVDFIREIEKNSGDFMGYASIDFKKIVGFREEIQNFFDGLPPEFKSQSRWKNVKRRLRSLCP